MAQEEILIYKIPTSIHDESDAELICSISREGQSLTIRGMNKNWASTYSDIIKNSSGRPDIGKDKYGLVTILNSTYGREVHYGDQIEDGVFAEESATLPFKITLKV